MTVPGLQLISFFGPFLLLLFCVVSLKWQLAKAAGLSWLVATVLWFQFPTVSLNSLLIACLRGFLVSLDVALILFGSVTFLRLLEMCGDTEVIKTEVSRVAGHFSLVTALLLGLFFCGFIEGAAGFGAPAAIVAPLLVTLGFSPLLAISLSLVGDSVSVPFGAVGTPIRIGFEGLENEGVASIVAGINLVAAVVVPLFIYYFFKKEDAKVSASASRLSGSQLSGFAFACFTLPAFFVSFSGPEFPSLVGSVIGGICFLTAVNRWRGQTLSLKPLFKSFFPYLVLAALLILGKLIFKSEKVLLSEELNISINKFQPGIAFLIAFMLVYLKHRVRRRNLSLRPAINTAASRLPAVTLAVFFMATMAQYSMMFFEAERLVPVLENCDFVRFVFVFVTPFIGAFGAFVTGSATVSNLLFGAVLLKLGTQFQVNAILILSLQVIGAGAGNMISLQNIAAVQAAVGIRGNEHTIIKKLMVPCLCYTILIGLTGILLLTVKEF